MEKKLIYLDGTQLLYFKMVVVQLLTEKNEEITPLLNSLVASYKLLSSCDILKDTKYLNLWLFNLDVVRKYFVDLGFDVCPVVLENFCKSFFNYIEK